MKPRRTHAADAERRAEDLSHDETDALDLADDAEEAMPLTVNLRGLRAAEEA